MGISLTKRRYLTWTTILIAGLGLLVGYLLKCYFPTHYFSWYPSIPVYFYVFNCFFIIMFDECRQHAPNKMLMVYMGTKVIKLLLSIFVILFYSVLVKVQREDFVLTFFFFYLCTMLYGSYFFYVFELNKKRKKERNE
ncbi:MAG: hypothetical protein RR319_02370 [Bacteroides sp.]